MSDVARLAAVFRAAANGLVFSPFDELIEQRLQREPDATTVNIAGHEFTRDQMFADAVRNLRQDSDHGYSMYCAYDGVASLFERLVEMERPTPSPEGEATEPETLAYLVVAPGYQWPTTNEGAAQRQLAIVPNARVIELIERPTAPPRGD